MKSIKFLASATLLALAVAPLSAQWKTRYPDIPRVDVHIHISSPENNANYLKLRDVALERSGADLAAWVTMDSRQGPITSPAEMLETSQGRMLSAFADYDPHKGVHHNLVDFIAKKEAGFAGYKLWFGPYTRVLKEGEKGIQQPNDPAFQAVFDAARATGLPMLSMHIADPNGPFGNRTNWMTDPVFYWESIRAAEDVVARNPGVTFVMAHMMWLVCQDGQIDYLRYLLSRYPNMYVDLAATFQYYSFVKPENLRDFMIEYADRIVYGTDGGVLSEDELADTSDRYSRTFAILEGNEVVHGAYFGNRDTQGLNLPREVLEKIYYKNALKLYPGLKESMAANGYKVE